MNWEGKPPILTMKQPEEMKLMQIKVNMECTLKILEKHGFEVEENPMERAQLNAKKKLDQETQRTILGNLNKGLENLIQSTKTPIMKEPISNT